MSTITAVLLGLIQGLTEFIPISSTAHLTLAGRLFGLISQTRPKEWTAFIAVVQLGTLVAVVAYFRRDLIRITSAFVRENLRRARAPMAKQSREARMGWHIIIGTLPIGVIGLALKKVIEGDLTKNLLVIAISLIVLAVVLWIAERRATFKRSMDDLTIRDALIMGCAQALAVFPGVSRSGVTITAGLFSGFERAAAARFSFLLSIPAVAGSGLLELRDALHEPTTYSAGTLIIATVVAGISGYASIALLLRYLRKHSTGIFIGYRLLLGTAILVALAVHYLTP